MSAPGTHPSKVIRTLREAEAMLGEGKTIAEAAKALGISDQTFHRWRNLYGGISADDAEPLKELERENRQLKAIVANQAAEEPRVEGDFSGNWQAGPASVERSRRCVSVLA